MREQAHLTTLVLIVGQIIDFCISAMYSSLMPSYDGVNQNLLLSLPFLGSPEGKSYEEVPFVPR